MRNKEKEVDQIVVKMHPKKKKAFRLVAVREDLTMTIPVLALVEKCIELKSAKKVMKHLEKI